MMVIKDLAERWGVSVVDAKRIVREGAVPFIALREVDMRINWSFVRFNPAAVEAWEQGRERTADAAAPEPAPCTAYRKTR